MDRGKNWPPAKSVKKSHEERVSKSVNSLHIGSVMCHEDFSMEKGMDYGTRKRQKNLA